MHPRIAVHEVSFPDSMDAAAILTWAGTQQISSVGLVSFRRRGGWQEAIPKMASSSVSIAYLCHASMFALEDPSSWDASTQALIETIDAAVAMRTSIVYATTGPAGGLDFEHAVDALSRAIVPAREHAASRGVHLLTETASPVFRFTHFLHTFQDTIDAAEAAGIGLCLDLHPTWHERALRDKIMAVGSRIKLVQVSDHILRNMTATRDVVGEGIVPIEALLGTLLETGYDGPVDLELFGRPPQTALEDILRSAERLSVILNRLGA